MRRPILGAHGSRGVLILRSSPLYMMRTVVRGPGGAVSASRADSELKRTAPRGDSIPFMGGFSARVSSLPGRRTSLSHASLSLILGRGLLRSALASSTSGWVVASLAGDGGSWKGRIVAVSEEAETVLLCPLDIALVHVLRDFKVTSMTFGRWWAKKALTAGMEAQICSARGATISRLPSKMTVKRARAVHLQYRGRARWRWRARCPTNARGDPGSSLLSMPW